VADVDVVGVGLNATDTVIVVPRFPPYGGKIPVGREFLSVGGQVATAMVTCARLGLRAKYIGTVGDDERGRLQMDSLRQSGIDIEHVRQRANCASQSAYIIVDESTGERTVFWSRPGCLVLLPADIAEEQITRARLLHIDGHDTLAVERAARIARKKGIPVTMDVDTVRDGLERVLPLVDYLIASSEFPAQWTGMEGPFDALAELHRQSGARLAAVTLGAPGALAFDGDRFVYSPGFIVKTVDTTGAGDVFHGAFCYAVLQQMSIAEALEFSNAMAALNCTSFGARGGIATLQDARRLIQSRAPRREDPDIAGRIGQR
jgi:sulfofructose kinase